jgi:aspartate-semialdehyde dehydrogenase
MVLRVAVLGATGNVGREMLAILDERQFPADEVYAVASRRSVGVEVSYGDRTLKTRDVENFDWSEVELCLMSAGGDVARQWAPKIAAAGCIVIDNSSAFRMDPEVPLIVPEVNADAVDGWSNKRIIANPNCSTAQLVVALKPLHDAAGVERVVVATYQSTSGAGREAMDELWTQTKGIYVNQAVEPQHFTKQIAFNVIPHIDVFMDDGFTKEEWKMRVETQKILDPDIEVVATCVRVPVFVGHSEAVHVELASPLSAADARRILREAPGVLVVDKREDEGYATPVECVGEWATYVSRIREDKSVEHGLAMWVVADNLRKGAALNAVQIAELLLNRGVLKPSQAAIEA